MVLTMMGLVMPHALASSAASLRPPGLPITMLCRNERYGIICFGKAPLNTPSHFARQDFNVTGSYFARKRTRGGCQPMVRSYHSSMFFKSCGVSSIVDVSRPQAKGCMSGDQPAGQSGFM